MKRLMLAVAAVVAAVGSGYSETAGARPLFENGTSVWTVAVGRDAARPVRYAAEEFVRTVERISGAKLAIVDAETAPAGPVVSIAANGESFVDRFGWKSEPNRILLRGNSPRGALFATYAFLRDNLDCRWYWAGETGEYLPKLGRYDVREGKKAYEPFFRSREMSICSVWRHRHPDSERWMPKVFLNSGANTPEIQDETGCVRIRGGHDIGLPSGESDKAFFEAHKDWYSLLHGERSPRGVAGCWSNEEFFRYTVTNLVRIIREGRIDIANLFIADVPQRCECADCTRDPDRSARFWNLYGRLIAEIRKELPGQHFAGLAYQEYRAVPGVKVSDLDYVEYCQYNRCYLHRLGDPACKANGKSMDEFRAWAKQAPLGLYGYEFDIFNETVNLPYHRIIADEMKVFKELGLTRVKTEFSVNIQKLREKNPPSPSSVGQLVHRLSNYCWAMMAFDPDQDVEALVKDFCGHVYGKGADDMYAFWSLLADGWEKLPNHVTYFANSIPATADLFLKAELEKTAAELLASAAAKTAGDARANAQVAIDAGAFKTWQNGAKSARQGGVELRLKEYSEDAYNMVQWLEAKGRKAPWQPTRFKVYRGKTALHILAECTEKEMDRLERGKPGVDAHDWSLASVELFLMCGDGASRQIAISPCGGVWDAKDGDAAWNSRAKVLPAFEADKWILDIELPYDGLGAKPTWSTVWKLMVIRNEPTGRPDVRSCGWPINAHRDYGRAANLRFN